MPFRSQETLTGWLEEFEQLGHRFANSVRVIEQDGSLGANTGLVHVALTSTGMGCYLEPVAPLDPNWTVTFESPEDAFSLDVIEVASLAAQISMVSALCSFLQGRSALAMQQENS